MIRPAVTRIVRANFRVVRTRHAYVWDLVTQAREDLGERRQVRTFFSEWAAYRCAARWLIFAKQDAIGAGPNGMGCPLCADAERERPATSYGYDGPPEPVRCRYHDSDSFTRITDRLARWLRWRDRRNG